MMFSDTHANSLGWLLDGELGSVNGVKCAVLFSGDGLLSSRTTSLEQEQAEKLAALGSTLRGAGHAYSNEFDGGDVCQLLVELTSHFVLITQAGENTVLLVQTSGVDADIDTISHQMNQLVERVGHEMKAEARRPSPEAPLR